jgi:glycosyltransferase involved in cell wall biosynthesis
VSGEIIGISKNGGIGTAMTGLAISLARAGFPVTILFTDGITFPSGKIKAAASHYGGLGIQFEALGPADLRAYAGPVAEAGFAMPAAVHAWLAARQFDIVHFNDTGGTGHLCLTAKRLGLGFASAHLAVAAHSPHRWIDSLNGSAPDSLLALCFQQAERASVACADTLWCPSRYLRDWLEADGFRLPADVIVQQYVMPPGEPLSASNATTSQNEKISEIVFFGRLEERKGLRVFCDAIAQLDQELAARGVAISFMGRPTLIDGIPATHWIAQQSARWRTQPKLMTGLTQPEAVAYLKGGGRLAVIASPADNSPCTIYESTNFEILFLAAATGGIPELVHPDDQPCVMFDYNVAALAKRIRGALDAPPARVRPAIGDSANSDNWVALHEDWSGRAQPAATAAAHSAKIAVVIRDEGAEGALEATLASLAPMRDQLYACLAVTRAAQAAPQGLLAAAGQLVSGEAAPAALAALAAVGAGALVLFLEAGCAVDPVALARHLDGMEQSGFDGAIPAGTLSSGKVVSAIGNGAMLAFHYGLLFTGGVLLRAELLQHALADGLGSSDAVTELLDRILLGGAEIIASPQSAFVLPRPSPRPAITSSRIALYTERAGSKALGALLAVAAQSERDGGLTQLVRRLGTRIVASRAGFLGPALARLWRARRSLPGLR